MGRTRHPGCCSQIGNLIVAGVNMGGSAVAASGPTEPRYTAANQNFTDVVGGYPTPAYRKILKSDIELVKID